MGEQGLISGTLMQRAQSTPMRIAENEGRPSITAEARALDAVRPLGGSVVPGVLKEGDVNVYTTLDFTAQRSADRTMLKHIAEINDEAGGRESVQGALVA